MTLQEKIDLVKKELFKNHPDCHHTIKILLWDDGTDLVQCQHGDDDNLYISRYYDDRLEYIIEPIFTPAYIETRDGQGFYVVTEDEFSDMFKSEIPCKTTYEDTLLSDIEV